MNSTVAVIRSPLRKNASKLKQPSSDDKENKQPNKLGSPASGIAGLGLSNRKANAAAASRARLGISDRLTRPTASSATRNGASSGVAGVQKRSSATSRLTQRQTMPSAPRAAVASRYIAREAARKSAAEAKKARAASVSAPRTKKGTRPAWDIKGRLADMEQLTGHLKQSVRSNEETVALLKKQLEDREQELRKVETVKEEVASDLTVRSEKLDAALGEIAELKAKLEKQESEFRKRKEDDLIKIKQAEFDLKQARERIAALESDVSNLRVTISTQETREIQIKEELTSKTRQCDKQQAEIERLQMELDEKTETVAMLEQKSREDEALRRKLHNSIQELKGNIRVFCRVRPPLKDTKEKSPLSFPGLTKNTIELTQTKASGISANKQADVFEEISGLVQSALDGYNTCIFAYGQTGSGKTYTMEGPNTDDLTDETIGVIPRSVQQIFRAMSSLEAKGWTYEMECFYLEIYNEQVYDLLKKSSKSGSDRKQLDIRIDEKGNPLVSDLRVVKVRTPTQIFDLLRVASANRAVAATECNERSSRSHSVFQLKLQGSNSETGENTTGLLNLIDLAGSERIRKSGSTGERLKEAQNINKSLSSLGDCIMALANKEKHIPYRNSKLTFLLSRSLGGNSKTLMFVNASPEEEDVGETLSSLRFAQKVNACEIGTARRQGKVNLHE